MTRYIFFNNQADGKERDNEKETKRKRKKPIDEERNLHSMARMGILVKQLDRPTVSLSRDQLYFRGLRRRRNEESEVWG